MPSAKTCPPHPVSDSPTARAEPPKAARAKRRKRHRVSRRTPHAEGRLALDEAMLRVIDCADLLSLRGDIRREFLAALAPEMPRWLDLEPGQSPWDGDLPALLGENKLVSRLEKAIDLLGLELHELEALLAILAPRVTGDGVEGKPTEHPPGSPEKVSVLIKRAAAGLPLFHPDDKGCKYLWGADRLRALLGDRPEPRPGD